MRPYSMENLQKRVRVMTSAEKLRKALDDLNRDVKFTHAPSPRELDMMLRLLAIHWIRDAHSRQKL
jgi:hypothetical protein